MTPHYYLNEKGKLLFEVGKANPILELDNSKKKAFAQDLKLALIDRDGVVIEKAPAHQYFKSEREIKVLLGVPEAIARLNKLGFFVALVSNQPGISRRVFSLEDLQNMTAEIERQISSAQARIDGVFFCPHKKPEEDGEAGCICRKPLTGMLLAAMEFYGAKKEHTFMFGDSAQDIEAAAKAGARPVYIATEHDEYAAASSKIQDLYPEVWGSFKFANLLAAVNALFGAYI